MTAPTPPSPRATDRSDNSDSSLPVLFGTETQLLGWQGLTATLPHDWGLRKFEGTQEKGKMSIVDDEGLRLELLWETPKNRADIEESVNRFLQSLEREASKNKRAFRLADHPNIIEKKRGNRAQLVNFGWIGEAGDPVASQGWGAAWECSHCKRVIVTHLVGRGNEPTRKIQKLAREVLSSFECHGNGGWQTWAVFGLQVEVPEEFKLGKAQLLTGRLDIEWKRTTPRSFIVPTWAHRDERIGVQRVAAANVLLEHESLADWTERTITGADKKRSFQAPTEITIHGHDGLLFSGQPRDPRQQLLRLILQKVLKKPVTPIELRVWHCEQSNKIFIVDTELKQADAHVGVDVLDSLECH